MSAACIVEALRTAGGRRGDWDEIRLAWMQALDADPSRLNVRGGAMALGHPLGASGTKPMSTLANALRARTAHWLFTSYCSFAAPCCFQRLR